MPSDSKNNHSILGIVCPYCGRTCALGTKRCPNCHHELKDPHYTLSNNFQTSPTATKKSKILKGTAIILVILFAVGLGWLFKNKTITNNSLSPYIYVQINYYNKQKRILQTDYYVAKQNVSNKKAQHKFILGYLGRGKRGKNLIRDNDITTMGKRFTHTSHYQLRIHKKVTYLTGPQFITIKESSAIVLPARQINGFNPTHVPATNILKCKSKNQQVHFIKIIPVAISANS
ncbi:hypothetical protein H5S09_09465 [Limosilactobacillus sp. STM2_1]|uniref:Uncharacterized protein n=1 Tax=Limosilactobacillus rudii TaxID=2759755 RepID=A0A7W3UM86_9LACO|nr:hypothetical protein [Limosilactobacillus rudii]MBB1078732.1 hypothetical protein [Limosilactobacillus rudii]MBB1098164.1 hypothetical protein [Limosilactobacillus rudii]MCD7135236.1 hypothetical protein [Limosilactobacillus rudii]